MNFDFNEVKESRSFVGYGINNSVTIISVESGVQENEKKTPFIQINLKNTGDTDDNKTIQKVFMSEKAINVGMVKLMAIHSAVAQVEQLKQQKFETLSDMAAYLNAQWSGRKLRLKLIAEEYKGTDADGNPKTKVRTSLPIRDFCEAIEAGATMHPIADENTQLRFSKDNEKDYKRLSPPSGSDSLNAMQDDANDTSDEGGLPF